MDRPTESNPGFFQSSRRLLNTTLAMVENRLELFLVELREEQHRLFHALLLVCAFTVFGLMALLLVNVTLVVAFWDSARLPVLAALSAGHVLAAGVIFWRLKVRLQNWPAFSATLDELKKDRACLDEKN